MILTIIFISLCVISIVANVFVFIANKDLTDSMTKLKVENTFLQDKIAKKGEINKELNEKMLNMRNAFKHNDQQIREQDQVIIDLHNEIKELKKSK